jgi:hypothetical protein
MMPDPSLQSESPVSRFADGYFPPQPPPQMAVDNETITKLIQQLEADRRAYLATFEKINETLSQALSAQSGLPEIRPGIVHRPTVSSTGSLIVTAADHPPSSPKIPASTASRRTNPSTRPLDRDGQPKGSIWTAEDSSDSDDDESYFAQETLPSREFTEDDLVEHLMTHDWDKYSRFILQDLLRNLDILGNGIFHKDRHVHQLDANHEHADIYHVGTDGAPLRYSRGDSEDGPLATWDALRTINADETRKQAVGRIITMREPPSSLLAALHLTMKEHFDMDSIYRLLINDDTPTKMITKGYLKKDHRRQRSIVFVFKYHTIVGEGRAPLPWQSHDDDALSEPKDGHIPLATCSAVVALSLCGRPSHTLRRNSRKTKSIVGHIYDPFAPWHVLSIQAFPDWNSSVDAHNTSHHYVNGPDAFLATVLSEYRDAIKRFKEVHRRIILLATPPNKAMFDSALRDELLFENDKFSYSRRYFWASQALGVLVNEIKAMVQAYDETFNEDFWTGEHKTLFPGTKDQSSRYSNWRKKLQHTRKLFEKEIKQLHDVQLMFQHQQKEIKGLREWLFSGTSVLESREAVNQARITVEQGYNIRLLTFVTLFFLPLTFVTSIFGMTNMPPEDSFLPFALTSVGICVPTYFIILVVNNVEKVKRWLTNMELYFTNIISCAVPDKAEKMKKNLQQQREKQALQQGHSQRRPMIRKAATHASLEPRLTSELTLEPIRHATHSILGATTRRVSQTLSHHLPGGGRRSHGMPSTPIKLPSLPSYSEERNDNTPTRQGRSSTVKFEDPIYSPSMLRTMELEGTMSNMEKTSTLSPISRGTTLVSQPSHHENPAAATGSTSSATMVEGPTTTTLQTLQQRSLTVPMNQSLFRRWSERLSPMQNSPRTPDSGELSPKEDV